MADSSTSTLFVNKKSVNSFLHQQMKKASPEAKEVLIATNTSLSNPDYNLISISPKQRGWQKSRFAGLLHRNAKWKLDPNGRSTDFLPTNMLSYGCRFMCAYCYVDRRDPATFPKLYDDALSVVSLIQESMENIDESRQLYRKATNKDFERYRDPKHSNYVTFDLGCDSDCVLDNKLTRNEDYPGHIIDIINQVSRVPEAMISFATKSADLDPFIKDVKNPNMCRIRLSLMPEEHRRVLEMNTSKIVDRITRINQLVDAGFEVHINLSPIVVTNNMNSEYSELLSLINESISDKAKKQLAYEIIFLTHDPKLNDKIVQYAPKACGMMNNGPLVLEPKPNKPNVFSYSRKDKNSLKKTMISLINQFTPYSRIRYMF